MFPFKYFGTNIYQCIFDFDLFAHTVIKLSYSQKADIGFNQSINALKGEYIRFCGTTSDFDRDKKSGYCQGM